MISSQKNILFWVTLFLGALFLWPYHDFQYWMAQGDHGRELYAFKKVWEGALPYRDFSWVFGPLLPYYFGAFFVFFGENIQSILFAQLLLTLSTSLLVYFICLEFITPALACAGALWYVCLRGYEFPHSYHHSGVVLLVTLVVFFLFRYIKTKRPAYIFSGFFSIFLLCLTRLNLGMVNLAAFVFCLFLMDIMTNRKTIWSRFIFYALCSLGVICATVSVYYLLLHDVPGYVLHQTFPYSKANLAVSSGVTMAGTSSSFFKLIQHQFTINLLLKAFALWLLLGAGQIFYLCLRKKLPDTQRKEIFFIFGSLITFMLLNLHEFLFSGIIYRLYWAFPIIVISILYVADYTMRTGNTKIYSRLVRLIIILVLFCPVSFGGSSIFKDTFPYKEPEFGLHVGNQHIYTQQGLSGWGNTVKSTVEFINENAGVNEKILAIPHASLYYFLTERDGGTRQLDFFEHNHISQQQERNIIAELESNGVNWIIISNRVNSLEHGMGVFGVTHCLLITEYIHDHFETAAEFGDLNMPGGWAWNHATRVLKRKATK